MIKKKNIVLAIISGVLLTGAFPKIGLDWLAWIALVPLLYAVKDLSVGAGFRVGFITGLVHFLSLLYWLVPVMRTYGYLPIFLSVSILILLAAVLALFIALFSTVLTAVGRRPAGCRPAATGRAAGADRAPAARLATAGPGPVPP